MPRPSKTRPLASKSEAELTTTIATILSKTGELTPMEYGELVEINWELRFRGLLYPSTVSLDALLERKVPVV